MKTKYQWKRYWTPTDGQISLADGGFLDDPSDEFGKLVNADLISLDAENNTGCLVLLGEPGIGKSTEIRELYEATVKANGSEHTIWINLRDVMTPDAFIGLLTNNPLYKNWVDTGEPLYLFLDSFDEGMFSFKSFANYFSALLTEHFSKIPSLRLRISCRTALWQSYLEDDLSVLWKKEELKKYELCPLTRADVSSALLSRGIDKDKFISEINDKGVVGLAVKPLTLAFLMDLYEKDKQLPEKKDDIYSRGCEILITEPDSSKRNDPTLKATLTARQKNAVAERIAVASLVGGQPIITSDVRSTTGALSLDQLYGSEIIDDVPFSVGDEQIKEVLNSGLFSSRGADKMGWAHQSYGEFLAARYLFRHSLDWKQIQSLLFQDPLKIGVFQVVPQLYEVCAWLASIDRSFFDHAVLLDPEFLLLSDANVISDSQKSVLTQQLLIRLDKGELFDRREIFNYTNYKKLNNPEIAAQLEPYIAESTKSIVGRRVAIEIASACSVNQLEKLLVSVALEETEDLTIRVHCVLAISKIGSIKSQAELRPILAKGFQADLEDELKGVILKALWPKNMTVDEVFNLITSPKKRSLWGTYHGFIEHELSSSLQEEHILRGLEWIQLNALHLHDIEYSFRSLSDAIMLKAWEHITKPEILEAFAHISYDRLNSFDEIIGERTFHKEILADFQSDLEKQDENRRALIKKIILIAQSENPTSSKRGYILIHHGRVRLIYAKDVPWLIEWLTEENDVEIQKTLSELIGRVFDKSNTAQIELIFKARETNELLKAETSFWFLSVDLNSQSANDQREQWQEQMSWQTKREKDEIEEISKAISKDTIEELLKKSEAGDMDSYWQLHNRLCMYQHEIDEEDLFEMPGWKILDENTRQRIIVCGEVFLERMESHPEIWLGQGKNYFPALTGYRMIKIFYNQERNFIENQETSFWKRWAPITLAFPRVSNDPKNGELIALAYKSVPEEVLKTLDVLIDDEAQKYDGLFINDLLEDCLDPQMCKFLLGKAIQPGFSRKASGEIIRFLLSHNVEEAKEYVKSKIHIPVPTDPIEKEDVLSSAASLLWNANTKDWDFLWNLIVQDNDFGRALIEKSHDSPLRGSSVLQSLSESRLADLYIWIMKEFSPEEYYRPEGGGTVTPEISISEWRDSVLRVLMDKGTAESCKEIERVSVAFPQYKWIREFTLIEARRITLQKSWQPAQPAQIFKLVENHDLRLVNTPDELMDIVLDSLMKFEDKLQSKEHPQAITLWNEKKEIKKQVISSPKDENRLSDAVAVHLTDDLKTRGVIVDREVEVSRGNKTDIHISVFSRDHLGRPLEAIKLTIETKGCWHHELSTAMESQLVGQYLSPDTCRCGIYLIGWFKCDKWNDSKDSRLAKTPKEDVESIKAKYGKQARDLSSQKSLRIEAFVLDCRLK